jgi:integrase
MLKAKEIEHAKPGMHSDGNGLYLRVQNSGAKGWIFRFQLNGRRREMGLGILEDKPVVDARTEALNLSKLVRQGIDPIEERKAQRIADLSNSIRKVPTFSEAATQFIDSKEDGWRNAKHRQQWRNTLSTYCAPFNSKSVETVTIDDVEGILRPIWLSKTETAARILTRIVRVISYAADKGWSEDDAGTWSSRLHRRLPAIKKSERVVHYPALPFLQISAFMTDLHTRPGTAAKALEFSILCASRSGEVRFAKWSEIDIDAMKWVIPGARMKMKTPHTVMLSRQAIALLQSICPKNATKDELIFPGERPSRPLSDNTIRAVIRRNKTAWLDEHGKLVVPHGFRSTFRDWAAEKTDHDSDVIEMSLAHSIKNATERAYRRGNLAEKRQRLMQDWADYCDGNF